MCASYVCKCGHMDVCACALLHILLFAKHSNILNKLSASSDFFLSLRCPWHQSGIVVKVLHLAKVRSVVEFPM